MNGAWLRRAVLGGSLLAILLGGSSAVAADSAADTRRECSEAYVRAQESKAARKLRAAREDLVLCGQDACLAAVKKDCVAWLDDVNAALPSIVIGARGPDGADTSAVRVLVDGVLVAEALDGSALELDPGPHKLRFEPAQGKPAELEVVLREGEKRRAVDVVFEAEAPPPAPPAVSKPARHAPARTRPTTTSPERSSPPVAAYVLGGVGVVGVTTAVVFWLSAESARSELDASGCAPGCADSDVDSIRHRRLFGDVALGVGVAALAGAAYFWFSGAPPAKTETARAPWRRRFEIRTLPGGALLSAGARF